MKIYMFNVSWEDEHDGHPVVERRIGFTINGVDGVHCRSMEMQNQVGYIEKAGHEPIFLQDKECNTQSGHVKTLIHDEYA